MRLCAANIWRVRTRKFFAPQRIEYLPFRPKAPWPPAIRMTTADGFSGCIGRDACLAPSGVVMLTRRVTWAYVAELSTSNRTTEAMRVKEEIMQSALDGQGKAMAYLYALA